MTKPQIPYWDVYVPPAVQELMTIKLLITMITKKTITITITTDNNNIK